MGEKAERAAVDFLESRGYRIEAVNWRESRFELDIVAFKGGLLAIVEVKASASDYMGSPELRVDRRKQKRIIAAAEEYLSRLDYEPDEIRFDVIAVKWRKGQSPAIRHIESAFIVEDD